MAQITLAFREAALRRGILIKSKKTSDSSSALAYGAVVEFANLGFIVKPEELAGVTVAEVEASLKVARKIIGSDRDLTPIYPGFPKQVQELSTTQLLVEQILHYWTGGAFIPNYPTIAREGLPLADMLRNARELEVLSASATARKVIASLVAAPVALSQDDKSLLEGALKLQAPTLQEAADFVATARNGENIQTFVGLLLTSSKLTADEVLQATVPGASNSDQILRLILVAASVHSAERWAVNYKLAVETLSDANFRAVKVSNLARPTRRVILKRLAEVTGGFKADSLVARQDLWRRVMRAVHPYDFKPVGAELRAADIIHSNLEYRTLNSLVEDAMASRKVKKAVKLLKENQPGNLLRRGVALLRIVRSESDAQALADALREVGSKAAVSTLISSYNGLLAANDEGARVTRVAGLTNTMVDRTNVVKVDKAHLKIVTDAVLQALTEALKRTEAPKGKVAVTSKVPVPLVRRDAATADRTLDRGQELGVAGNGDTVRLFGHFRNNHDISGYMDIGVVILDKDFNKLDVLTWNTWNTARKWGTYSGDKCVAPGDHAAEYFDVDMDAVRKAIPKARYAALTVQSYSGWPIDTVDFIAGAMLRSKPNSGEVFDARSVVTAFKPTTTSTQAVPLVVDLNKGRLTWLDSSSGSTATGMSSSGDDSIGAIVRDELKRPRLTLGHLAKLWAEAHGVATVKAPVDREAILGLLD